MIIDKIKLQSHVDNKLVSVQKHPDYDIYIYNYTKHTQYNKLWDDVTLMCRGLILDKDINVISIPFKKFFNLEEHDPSEIPNLPFDAFKKMDGSLGISYKVNNHIGIATRGSFVSTQSELANEILNTKYKHCLGNFENGKTYLFEIIHPSNKIIVNYGLMVDLVLLAIIDNETGLDLPLVDIGIPIVEKYDGIKDFKYIKALNTDNEEGFVLLFENGFRCKIKFEEYCRLSRIITRVSNVTIWEYLSSGRSLNELLELVPDEFYIWVHNTVRELTNQFNHIASEALASYKEFETKKEAAEYIKTQKYQSVLFEMLNNRYYGHIIWGMVKPKWKLMDAFAELENN
jgi:hypothetical protein